MSRKHANMAHLSLAFVKRPCWQVAELIWRICLATFGGYLFTNAIISLVARLCALLFNISLASSLLSLMLLSFLIYSFIIISVIASRRLARTSLWLLGISIVALLLCQLPQLEAVAAAVTTTEVRAN